MSDHNTSKTGLAMAAAPLASALAGMTALAVAMGIGRFAFTPVLPMMLRDAGLSLAGGGLLASANYLGYLLGALSAMAVHVQPERAIRGGLLAIGLTTLAMGLPLPFAAWLLLRLLAGAASAWVLISVSAWSLETLAAYQRPFLNSVVFAGVGTGIAAAGVLCLALAGIGAASAHAWTALGAASLVFCALVWRFFQPHLHAAGAGAPAARSRYRWDARSIRMVCSYGAFGFGYIIPATFLPVMAQSAMQGAAMSGWSWPVFGAAAALSTLGASALVRRIGNRRLWIACQFIMAIGILLPAAAPGLPAIFMAAVCVGGTFMVITLVALQEARRVAGRDAKVLIAAMTSAFAAGQIIGPLTVASDGGFAPGLVTAALLLVCGALALISKDS